MTQDAADTAAPTVVASAVGDSAPPVCGALERVPAWMLAVGSILSVQLGAALSTYLFDDIGVIGTAWLRLSLAAIVLVVLVRPSLRSYSWPQLRTAILLGLVSAGMTVAFLAAIDRLPLGTVVAIEFLGPLVVAAINTHRRRALVWPALAFVGVLLLTEPWKGEANVPGIALAVLSGVGWGLYIVITQRVGDQFTGLDGLAISIPVAALATAVVGVPQAWGHLTVNVLLLAALAAALLPLIPWTLEMMALRRMNKAAFGTLMALEPAVALMIGLIVLTQVPTGWEILGIVCVVVAGVAAERTGRRDAELPDFTSPVE